MPLRLSWQAGSAETRELTPVAFNVAPAAHADPRLRVAVQSQVATNAADPGSDKPRATPTSHQPTSPPAQKSLRQIRPPPLPVEISADHRDTARRQLPPNPSQPTGFLLRRRRKNLQPSKWLTNPSGTRVRAPTARAPALGMDHHHHHPPRLNDLRGRRRRGNGGMNKKRNKKKEMLTLDFFGIEQPRLHPPRWSDPQVRPQHLPSVLPREGRRHWLRQGMPRAPRNPAPSAETQLPPKTPHPSNAESLLFTVPVNEPMAARG